MLAAFLALFAPSYAFLSLFLTFFADVASFGLSLVPFWPPPGQPQVLLSQGFQKDSLVFLSSGRSRQDSPKGPLCQPFWLPKAPEDAPKARPKDPEGAQKGPKASQRTPKATQRHPKIPQRSPKTAKESQNDAQGPKRSPMCPFVGACWPIFKDFAPIFRPKGRPSGAQSSPKHPKSPCFN